MKKSLFLLALTLVSLFGAQTAFAAKELYTSWIPSEKTLEFYYDENKASHQNVELIVDGEPYWRDYHKQVEIIWLSETMKNYKPKSFKGFFCNLDKFYFLENLKQIRALTNLNTSEATDMSQMFYGCTSLSSYLDFSNFVTVNVTDMSKMFYNCPSLTSLNLSSFNSANLENMTLMFSGCTNLTSVTFGTKFTAAKVTQMMAVFEDCTSLESMNLSNFTATNTTNFDGMFKNCSALKSVTFGTTFSSDKVRSYWAMFNGCEKLQTIDLNSFAFPNNFLLDVALMFCECSSLTTITCDKIVKYVNSGTNMFLGCTALKGGKGAVYNTNYLDETFARPDGGSDNPGYFTGTFEPEKKVYTASYQYTLTYYYDGYPDYKNGNIEYYVPTKLHFIAFPDEIQTAYIHESMKNYAPTSLHNLFYGGADAYALKNLKKIVGLENLNMTNVKDISGMFQYCESLEKVDLANFNTSKVTDMSTMFRGCKALKNIDINHFNTENVESFTQMFNGCEALDAIDLSYFDTRKANSFYGMFEGCTNLKTLILDGWKIQTTSSIMGERMFKDCSSLKTIMWDEDLSKASNFSGTDMFAGCSKLEGSMGTKCDGTTNVNKNYARIDGGSESKGYFSQVRNVYTVFDGNETLTYYYDNKYDLNNPYHELYNLNDVRFKTYHSKVKKAVIDPSMKDAKLSSMSCLFFGETNCSLENMETIEGMDNLNTSEVKDMSWMFINCAALKEIDLSSLDLSKVSDTRLMFGRCYELTTIHCDYDFSKLDAYYCKDMFKDCSKLVGEKGTTCDGTHNIDGSYARPDGGPESETPGYFTVKKIADDPELVDAAKEEMEKWLMLVSMLQESLDPTKDAETLAKIEKLIDKAEKIDEKENATLAEVNAMTAELQTVVKAHPDEAVQGMKEFLTVELNYMLKPEDSDACKQIIEDAIKEINKLEWDDKLSFEDNVEALFLAAETIYEEASDDLEAERKSEGGGSGSGSGSGGSGSGGSGSGGSGSGGSGSGGSGSGGSGGSGGGKGLDDVDAATAQSSKVLIDGVMYIIRDGKIYTTTGQIVK